MGLPPLPRATVLLLATAAVAACGRPAGAPGRTRLTVPSLAPGNQPGWTGLKDGEPVVAEAGGLPIPASRYRRALIAAGPDADPTIVLDDVVARELLAQEAVRTAPGGTAAPSEAVYRRALASRLLRDRFVDDFHPADVPMADLQALFQVPQVYGKFNHLRIFSVQDYQWICCEGNARSCQTPEAESCFEDGSAAMSALHDAVLRDHPDGADLRLLVEKYQQIAPRLSYQEYDFAYDDDARVQKGSVLIDDSVVEAALLTEPGHFAAHPVRSNFGWHVLYVKAMLPPVHEDLSNPDVRRQVSEYFFPRFQQKRLVEFLASLVPVQGFRMLEAAFRGHPPDAKPRYEVELYPETLSEAVEATARHKEDEPGL